MWLGRCGSSVKTFSPVPYCGAILRCLTRQLKPTKVIVATLLEFNPFRGRKPVEVVAKINAEIVCQLQTPAAHERLVADGWSLVADTPRKHAKFLRAEIAKCA